MELKILLNQVVHKKLYWNNMKGDLHCRKELSQQRAVALFIAGLLEKHVRNAGICCKILLFV